MQIIEVKNLVKTFNQKGKKKKLFFREKNTFSAVNDISFSIKKGDIIGFIGPNGAGKSTTIKMLTGIISKTSGKILVDGLDPFKDRKKLSYKIGCMFGQKSQLYMHLSVKDSLCLLGSIYDIRKDILETRINKIAKLFEIEEYLDKTVRKLSLGQRMICEIAACIIHEPEIIFLDEPTIGLDIIAKLRVREIIQKLNKEGVTVILTSHDISDVMMLCNSIIVINKGIIIENSKIEDIKKKYLSKKTLTFYYQADISNLDLKYQDYVISSETTKNKIMVKIDTNTCNVNEIINYYVSIGEICDINITSTSMEEVIKDIYERKISL